MPEMKKRVSGDDDDHRLWTVEIVIFEIVFS